MSPRAVRLPLRVRAELKYSGAPPGARVATVTCSELAPSINDMLRMHHMRWAGEAKRWVDAVERECALLRVRLASPVRIDSDFFFRTRRRRDRWNHIPKWAIDGIVKSGLIEDDRDECVDPTSAVRLHVDPKNPRMVITVTELNGGRA